MRKCFIDKESHRQMVTFIIGFELTIMKHLMVLRLLAMVYE